jgi:hypothetical protein
MASNLRTMRFSAGVPGGPTRLDLEAGLHRPTERGRATPGLAARSEKSSLEPVLRQAFECPWGQRKAGGQLPEAIRRFVLMQSCARMEPRHIATQAAKG